MGRRGEDSEKRGKEKFEKVECGEEIGRSVDMRGGSMSSRGEVGREEGRRESRKIGGATNQ